jgi:hypothetical protein
MIRTVSINNGEMKFWYVGRLGFVYCAKPNRSCKHRFEVMWRNRVIFKLVRAEESFWQKDSARAASASAPQAS